MTRSRHAFIEDTHTYRIDDHDVPSVTQILGVLNDFSKVPWQRLEAARERGTLVHKAGELLLRDELDWDSIDSEIQSYMVGLKQFIEDSGAVVTGTEILVWHDKLQYGGTLDAVAWWRRGDCLIDWKTAVIAPRSVGPQLAGYEEAYYEYTGRRIRRHYCVQLLPGAYKVNRVDHPVNWTVFMSALNIHNFRERNP